jgi:hypothetical protein
VDWESWLGPAPYREFAGDAYHPFNWRGWWDFGTGALGDMACHNCNLPFMALDMREPMSIEAMTTGHNADSFPNRSTIRFEIPKRNGRPAFPFTWYDGGNLPPAELFAGVPARGGREKQAPVSNGLLIIGELGKLYVPRDGDRQRSHVVGDVQPIDVDFPEATSPGGEAGHVREWFLAMQDANRPAMSNFPDYAGPLTETILAGNLAVWNAREGKGERIAWDPKGLTSSSHPELAQLVRRQYRDGHEV